MVPFSLVLSIVLALYLGSAIADPPSNLPPEPPGVFTVRGSSIIDADLDTTWAFLLNFSSYPDWNPFVRSAVVTDVWGIPLDDQVPHLNSTLRFNTQIPPLPAPVNASTPSKLFNDHLTIEAVIHLDLEHHIVAWGPKGLPESILRADRWSSVSSFVDEADGRTKSFYESRQVYSGGLASTVQVLLEDAINESFQAQADEMKRVLE